MCVLYTPVEREENLCNAVEIVIEFMYPGVRVSAGGECEAAVTVKTRCGWVRYI